MSRFTRTVNLYPVGTLIVGWTFRFRLVIWAPVWLISRPTDALAVSVTLGYVRALCVFRCDKSNAAENALVSAANPKSRL